MVRPKKSGRPIVDLSNDVIPKPTTIQQIEPLNYNVQLMPPMCSILNFIILWDIKTHNVFFPGFGSKSSERRQAEIWRQIKALDASEC